MNFVSILILRPICFLECNCHPQGSANNTCNNQTGECFCKNEYVTGDKCDECVEGIFNCLSPNGLGGRKWNVAPNHVQVIIQLIAILIFETFREL